MSDRQTPCAEPWRPWAMESKVVSIRLPAWLLKELDGDARALGLTRSEFIKSIFFGYKQSQREIDEYISYMAAEAEKGSNNG